LPYLHQVRLSSVSILSDEIYIIYFLYLFRDSSAIDFFKELLTPFPIGKLLSKSFFQNNNYLLSNGMQYQIIRIDRVSSCPQFDVNQTIGLPVFFVFQTTKTYSASVDIPSCQVDPWVRHHLSTVTCALRGGSKTPLPTEFNSSLKTKKLNSSSSDKLFLLIPTTTFLLYSFSCILRIKIKR